MTTDEEIRQARVAELQRRRAGSGSSQVRSAEVAEPTEIPRSRSRVEPIHSAVGSGSKIAATGLGFTAMLGLVAAMGYANRTAPSESVPVSTAAAQVVVVIHPSDGSTPPASSVPIAGDAPSPANDPVVLTAQPTVRQAPVTQAPTGRTNGSR